MAKYPNKSAFNPNYWEKIIVSFTLLKKEGLNISLLAEDMVWRGIPVGGEVVGVTVDDKYMDDNNKFNLDKTNLITYSHGEYFTLGEKLGTFGYSVKKKGKKTRQDKILKKKSSIKKSSDNKKLKNK